LPASQEPGFKTEIVLQDLDFVMEEPLTEANTIETGVCDSAAVTRIDGEPLIGSMLSGRYLVKRKLGHGGFGVVYLASDEKMLSRPVVVKALGE